MKHSIRVKLSIIIMSIVAGLVLFCCLFNALFLEKYYIRQQQKALVQSFDRIKEVINGSDIDQNELGKVMYDISTERNMTALVVDSNFEKVYSLKADIDKTKKWLQDFYFLQSPSSSNVIARSDSYVIQTSYNIYDQQSYLELIGNDDNYMYNILIQVPLESISKKCRNIEPVLYNCRCCWNACGRYNSLFCGRPVYKTYKKVVFDRRSNGKNGL